MKIKPGLIATATIMAIFSLPSAVLAQTAPPPVEKRQDNPAAILNHPYYSDNVCATRECSCSVGNSFTGSGDNERDIYTFFVLKGLEPYHAAGIMGNMKAESGLNPRALEPFPGEGDQPIEGRGFGLVQWTFSSRQQPLVDRAQAAGVLPSDLGVQLEYVIHELTNGYDGRTEVMQKFKMTTTVSEATIFIEQNYEVHDGPLQPDRVTFAEEFMRKFSSSAPTSNSVGSSACAINSSGQVVGNYSLPVARKFYDENPDWFTKPHHDYPASDIPVPDGTPVYAIAGGKVIAGGNGGSCGMGIIVESADGVRIIYCHGSDGGNVPGAEVDSVVKPGDIIMNSSYTGDVRPPGPAGAHLHVQIQINGQNRCPQTLFSGIVAGSPPDIQSLPSSGCTN